MGGLFSRKKKNNKELTKNQIDLAALKARIHMDMLRDRKNKELIAAEQ